MVSAAKISAPPPPYCPKWTRLQKGVHPGSKMGQYAAVPKRTLTATHATRRSKMDLRYWVNVSLRKMRTVPGSRLKTRHSELLFTPPQFLCETISQQFTKSLQWFHPPSIVTEKCDANLRTRSVAQQSLLQAWLCYKWAFDKSSAPLSWDESFVKLDSPGSPLQFMTDLLSHPTFGYDFRVLGDSGKSW